MPEIEHFRGILYNRNMVDVSKVVAPPFDVISPEDKMGYQSLSEYNIVNLLLEDALPGDNEVDNKYARTARRFKKWFNGGILIRDEMPGFYVYAQEFEHEDEIKTRIGFIGLMRIADDETEILPHENTFEETKMDRLSLLKEVKANLSPIFTVFDDPQAQVERLLVDFVSRAYEPEILIADDEVTHKIWCLTDNTLINKIAEYLRSTFLFIADGHHRYESAKLYRDLMRSKLGKFTGDERFNFVMSYFVGCADKGLTIFPTHRIVSEVELEKIYRKMTENFLIEEVAGYDEMVNRMREGINLIGAYDGQKFSLLKLKEGICLDDGRSGAIRDLDVTVLHSFLIPTGMDVQFTRDADEVIAVVRSDPKSFGFFLNPVKVDQIKRVALSGERMPHKSTYFYPKLLSGLVINLLE